MAPWLTDIQTNFIQERTVMDLFTSKETHELLQLTGFQTAHDLFAHIVRTTIPAPKLKSRIQTAKEFYASGCGNDWEVANFNFKILTALGYTCRILFLATQKDLCGASQATTLYRSRNGVWRAMVWSTKLEKGIFGPHVRLIELIDVLKQAFTATYSKPLFSSLGYDTVPDRCDIKTYFDMVNCWKPPS